MRKLSSTARSSATSDRAPRHWTSTASCAGSGCVYPPLVKTLPDQLDAAGLTWKAYMEDMGNDPAREPASCGHVPLGQRDITQVAQPHDQYAARHDPFVYFHSIIDDQQRCDAHVVNLEVPVARSRTPRHDAQLRVHHPESVQ